MGFAPTWLRQESPPLLHKTTLTTVTTGAIRRAKLQSNRHHQQTNVQLFTRRMPFLSPNQQCQSTEVLCIRRNKYGRILAVSMVFKRSHLLTSRCCTDRLAFLFTYLFTLATQKICSGGHANKQALLLLKTLIYLIRMLVTQFSLLLSVI